MCAIVHVARRSCHCSLRSLLPIHSSANSCRLRGWNLQSRWRVLGDADEVLLSHARIRVQASWLAFSSRREVNPPRGSSRSPSQKPGPGRSGGTPSGDHEFADPPGLEARVPHHLACLKRVPHPTPRAGAGQGPDLCRDDRRGLSFPASAEGHGAALPGIGRPGRAGLA